MHMLTKHAWVRGARAAENVATRCTRLIHSFNPSVKAAYLGVCLSVVVLYGLSVVDGPHASERLHARR